MATLTMPRLSDSMEDGTIVRWLVDDGATVAVGDELVEVETDKAVMPYEAEQAGTLRIVAREGETVAVGAAIAQLLADGEEPAAPPEHRPALGSSHDPATGHSEPAAPAREAAETTDGGAVATTTAAVVSSSNGRRAPATPVARRIAAQLGVDLLALAGSGPHGRVVKRDVLAASSAPTAGNGAVAAPPVADPAAQPAVAASGRGATTVQQLSRLQQTVARRMAEAKANQPEFTLTVEIDMGPALDLRAQLKAAAGDQDPSAPPAPTVNDLVVKAVAQALRANPRANGAYRDGRFELYERVNVGMAVAASDALLVPVVTDADTLSLGGIAARTSQLAARAREGTLTPPELSGGTFTVSNLGMFGIAHFTAILNAPQAGILAVGAIRELPVVRDGAIVVGRRMAATLTCDHRILYGADAARFLADVRARLEDPFRLIL